MVSKTMYFHLNFCCFKADKFKWHQQVRLRHVTSRKYLCVGPDLKMDLTDDGRVPETVFKFHSVLQVCEFDEILLE